MVTQERILEVLRTIDDPEMPISIVDLGIVERVGVERTVVGASVDIEILPTFVGCPALGMIENEVTEKVSDLDGVERVKVRFVFEPPWSVDRISDEGRQSLAALGVTVPQRCGDQPLVQVGVSVACPFCESTQTHMVSPFGPTRCRSIHYCEACRNSFEQMKRVGGA